MTPILTSTLTQQTFPFTHLEEFTSNGESLEVQIPGIEKAKIRAGKHPWERFRDFIPFENMNPHASLGEGNTPLIDGGKLKEFTGIQGLLLKNETVNPTWSFKDRGSLFCVWMAESMGETITATISTGNMGNSIAAYGARAGLKVIVFCPHFTPSEKLAAMSVHGAKIIKITASDYSEMKSKVLELSSQLNLRIVSGNGPIRVEGYKMTAFELYEQMEGKVPDYIAIPSSACGHIRGVFKGYRELFAAGYIEKLPKIIVVQARNNSPLVSAIKQGKDAVIPYSNFHTIAEAITSGNPQGGNEIVLKAKEYGWLAENAAEDEIMFGQKWLAQSGFFVEPATATSLYALVKLREQGKIQAHETVIMMLTGAGFKDMDIARQHPADITETDLTQLTSVVQKQLS